MRGTLAIAATPIGNPADASPRLVRLLAQADVVAAEDTRRVHQLARALDVELTGRIVSYYEAVEQARIPGLLAHLAEGRTVALLTDAGMPTVSDPGFRLVSAAREAGARVTVIPGPSAVLAALAVSGLPSDRFCFEGFPPRKAGERDRWFGRLATEPRTIVVFESVHRITETLDSAVEQLGPDRPAVVCRELTKTHEEIRHGTLAELAQWARGGLRGELTVVIAGAAEERTGEPRDWAAEVAAAEAAGVARKQAIKDVAVRHRVRKGEVFDAVVAARHP